MRSLVLSAAALATSFFPAAHAQEVKAEPAPAASSDDCEATKYSIDEMMRLLIVAPLENWNADKIGNLGSYKTGMMIENVQKRVNSRMDDQEERILADVRNIRAGKGNMNWETLAAEVHYSFGGTIQLLKEEAITLEAAKAKLGEVREAFINDAVAKLQSFPARAVDCGANLTIS